MATQMLWSVVSVSSGPALFEATASSGSVSPLSLCNYGLHIHYGMANRIRTAELPLSFRNAELPHGLLRMLELLSYMLDLRLSGCDPAATPFLSAPPPLPPLHPEVQHRGDLEDGALYTVVPPWLVDML